VKLDGDLGRIAAGSTAPIAAKSLTVLSMGRYGTATQAVGGTLDTLFTGGVGKIAVKQDIHGANIVIGGGTSGTLRGLTIGGSLIGTDIDAQRGVINASADIGRIKIGKDIIGGASNSDNASIFAIGSIQAVTIRGSILASETGTIANARLSAQAFGPIKIGGDLRGGPASGSGTINVFPMTPGWAADAKISDAPTAAAATLPSGGITALRIGGSVIGGSGISSGMITCDAAGAVKIGGDIRGGEGISSGTLTATTIRSLALGGSVVGGDGDRSGVVFSGSDSGRIKIVGDIRGGEGTGSGRVEARGNLLSITLGGSLVGGPLPPPLANGGIAVESVTPPGSSGQIITGGDMGRVTIGHDVIGGDAADSGKIASSGKLLALNIRGSVVGGAGDQTASISIGSDGFAIASQISSIGDMGAVKIGHDVRGGEGIGTGHIYTDGALTSIALGGSLRGGSAIQTGRISADETIGAVKIRGGIFGGSGAESGAIVTQANIASMTIGLDLVSGSGIHSGHIGAQTIGALKIIGAVIGNAAQTASISASGIAGASSDAAAVAIRSVSIGGRIELGQILAGYDETGTAINADVQIGTIAVGGDWVRSDAAAGVAANAEGGFGTPDDALAPGGGTILSKIARITIKGQILGTPEAENSTDHYGIVAEQIGAVSVGGVPVELQFGPHNDAKNVGITGDVTVREI
jgi:hypothetical protein